MPRPTGVPWPAIYAMIFYRGQKNYKPYPAKLALPSLLNPQTFTPTILENNLQLIDLNTLSDEQIKTHKIIGLLEYTQKHAEVADWLPLTPTLRELIEDVFKHFYPHYLSLKHYPLAILYYIINACNVSDKRKFRQLLQESKYIGGKVMSTLASLFIKEGKVEGKIEGLQEGLQKGLQQGKLHMAEKIVINALKQNLSLKTIMNLTDLSAREIREIQRQALNHKNKSRKPNKLAAKSLKITKNTSR